MKRLMTLLLALAMLLTTAALAEAPAAVTISLPESGITFDIPADWYYTVAGKSEGSSLANLFGLTGEYLDSYLERNSYSFYATQDAQETFRMSVTIAPGTPLVDMRKEGVNMDALLEGFVSTFTAGEVVDSRIFQTSEGSFARIRCIAPVEGGAANLLIYACNTNATMYIINFFAMPDREFPEAELDAIINSIDFAD